LTTQRKKLKTANQTINDLKDSEYELIYMGNFKITHYCTERRAHICGGGQGITATGTTVTAGRTIAVDPSVIPYGTQVYIEGYGFRTAEDCGSAVGGKHLDIAVSSHSEAMSLGTVDKSVWMLVKKS
jgi:3D (Asp-Asp-Asp) domain-containing protein